MFWLCAFVGGLVAHQTDRVLRLIDRDVAQIGRYVVGLLTVLAFAAGRVPKADRARLVRGILQSAAGVGAGVSIGRLVDRLRE